MSSVQDIIDEVAALNSTLGTIKFKLDAIQALVAGLQGGQVATQAQVDALKAAVDGAVATAGTVVAEEDTINPPA